MEAGVSAVSLLAILLSFCAFRILRKPRDDARSNVTCGDGLQAADFARFHERRVNP